MILGYLIDLPIYIVSSTVRCTFRPPVVSLGAFLTGVRRKNPQYQPHRIGNWSYALDSCGAYIEPLPTFSRPACIDYKAHSDRRVLLLRFTPASRLNLVQKRVLVTDLGDSF